MDNQNIDCHELILGKNVRIEDNVKITGNKIQIGDNTIIRSGSIIDVKDIFEIGKNSIIGASTIIKGNTIRLDREFYSNHNAEIGGGSCFEETSSLICGYWCHLGSYSMINTAMPVKIGNEVGMGRFTNLYTHGAYLSIMHGFPSSFSPISIGNRVWIPSATINPGITIGSDVVIGGGSLVVKNIQSGSLAMGTPCEVVKENLYPKKLSIEEEVKIIDNIFEMSNISFEKCDELVYNSCGTIFDFNSMSIEGKISEGSERIRNLLRRNGIRFKVEIDNEYYEPWK